MSAFLARAPRRLRVVAALAVFLALAAGAAAQTETGRITGVVTDATGGILPGVTVTAKAVGTGATRELTTDSAGQYVFANLPPGAFEISAALAGFNTANAKVTVTVGGAFSVDLKLDVAGTKENVNVVAEVPRINVTNSEVADDDHRSADPRAADHHHATSTTSSRSRATSRAARSPTARNGPTTTRGTGYNINGQRASGTNILLDGSANNNEFDTHGRPERPARFRPGIQRRHQQLLGAVRPAPPAASSTSLTKSGTNSFRGTGYDFYRTDKLATNTFDNKANEIEKGEFTRHQLGFSIGGPIRRDKMHFFTQSRIHPRAQRGHADQLGADAAVHRGERAGDAGTSSPPTAAASTPAAPC